MAEEISSIATSSVTPPNWWPDLHSGSLSSWSSNTNPWQTPNPNSNSSGEEDVSISTSFTNASNHSGLSVESSRRLVDHSASANELIGETPSDNQLWSHLLLSVGSSGELSSTQEVGDNSINILSSKSYSSGMFEPACDYLKKMDNTWGFTNPPTTFNNFEKHFNESFMESESLNKLSNLVHNWSIAPPDSRIGRFDPRSATNMDTFSCYNHEQRVKGEQGDIEAPGALFRHFMNTNGSDYQMGLKNSILGDNGTKYYCGMPDVPCTSARSLGDVTFNGFLTKPSVDIPSSKRLLRSLNLSDSKRQGIEASPRPAISVSQTVTRSNVRGQGITSEGKKKRTEDSSEAASKKSKHEGPTVQSTKVPKVKITDKVTALQQIVSPFGKTDTASVLGEAIVNIKCLQDQVQLLISNPYMKTSASKDPWGSLESRDKGDMKVDLKSRGLCLVPISCTPQVYRENTGSDYWAPTYRGCLYR